VTETERPGSQLRSPLDHAYLDAVGTTALVARLRSEAAEQFH